MAAITALNIYPVKSCRGTALLEVTITPTGFEHDREWMIVRPDGRFVTQREQPRLAVIVPALEAPFLTLGAPGHGEIRLPLLHDGARSTVSIWGETCPAIDAGDEAARWLRDVLGQDFRLVRFDPVHRRLSNPEWTGAIAAANQFSDGFPLLVISEASLADLNSRLAKPLPMSRFRPNIVVSGVPAYGEDLVHEFAAADVRLRVVKPCTRCAITTTDQETGIRDGDEPIRTLRSYRLSRQPAGVLFGQNLVIVSGSGARLHVGQVLATTYG
jgi:uncharacterized protein YcbX